ncbi:hypothetical protein NQ318_022702 [Aromia moschata]|uniref:G-protein coupled receptors family 1 profile domain-containing protein n=1 Tax=Aromia moschata TaxID=1265417 RepID=A0AAV8YCQ5_9CUCU|nr:hypothetical protein NQ318_022702 [Aromia moschata]
MMLNLTEGNHPIVLNTSLHVVPENTRKIFYWIILTISVTTLIGNVLAIWSIVKRKCKFLQKTCIVCLALADIFSSVLFATNNLETLSQPLIIWSLGEFMCYFIPMGQVLGTTASSVALLVIALDRYQNVIYALSKRWNPQPLTCIGVAVVLWLVCAVLSYPMYIYFQYEPINILYIGPSSFEQEPVLEPAHMCVAVIKSRLTVYYVTMAFLIFLPIVLIFFWFYYKIAALIWKHRKPLSLRFHKFQKGAEPEDSSSTKTTELSSTLDKTLKSAIKKGKNVQVERKIRTFKIVLVLMITFTCCRLPYWSYYVVKVVGKVRGDIAWNLHFAFLALNMLNCTLNPLLYTFLNQTIRALKMLNDFMCKICCCCFSNAEFEDFEKDNPFLRETHDPKKPHVVAEHPKSTKNSKVKFDVAHLQPYCIEDGGSTLPKY